MPTADFWMLSGLGVMFFLILAGLGILFWVVT